MCSPIDGPRWTFEHFQHDVRGGGGLRRGTPPGHGRAGGGHFYCKERPEQITDLIAIEVGELLEIVARDAAAEINAPDGMTIAPLSLYRFEQHGSRSVLLLGDLVAG